MNDVIILLHIISIQHCCKGVLQMKRQTLILDLDDTLIHCNKYFRDAVNHFASQLQEWFPKLTKKEIKEKQLEIDIKSVEKHGLHSSRFPESLATTYKYFCEINNRATNEEEIERVRIIGQEVFQIEVQPFPSMYEVLQELQSEGHQLYLFTGGDEANQNRKIIQLELETYFEDRVFIFEHKNTEALKQVLDSINYDKKSTWMIGNSLKTDIQPAIELGINAVHIPAELEWTFNNSFEIDEDSTKNFYTLKTLKDVPRFIREHAKYDREAI